MANESPSGFVSVRDESGRVTGMMDRMTVDYLASQAPDPTQASINALLNRVSRLRVITLSNVTKKGDMPQALLDTVDPRSLDSFRDCFAISEDASTFGHCMCLGEPHIELFAGDEKIATFGYHHG